MKITTQNLTQLALFMLICYGVAYIGSMYAPGEWYQNIQKAPWTPPNIAFPIVWSVLYLFIAVAGWLIFASQVTKLKILWVIQLTLNAAWSWIFFGQHWMLIGLIDLLLLVSSLSLLIIACWKNNLKLATYLLLPYLIWLCVATSLNSYALLAN